MSVSSIGYARIESTDLDAWHNFASDILGLMVIRNNDSDDTLKIRMDDHPFRFLVQAGKNDRLLGCGLDCGSKNQWQKNIDILADAGYAFVKSSDEEAIARSVKELAVGQDPSGNTIELYHGRELTEEPMISPTQSRFITRDASSTDLGFGHAVLPTTETEKTLSFFRDLLQMPVCDDLTPPMPEGAPPARVIFMHANNPRQHSLALFNHPHPAGVIHLMVEVSSLDEVGSALDRVKKAGLPLMATLGRHVNDNMCSFYVVAPGGIAIEYGFDGLLVDWDHYTPTVSTIGDLWGHEYNVPT